MKTIIKATDTFKEIIGIYLTVVIICAIGYSFAEGKTFLDSLWWAFVTAMTVGYGDMYPVTLTGRGIAVILMHLAPLFVIPLIINQVFNKAVENKDKFTDEEQEQMKQSIKNIESLLITNKNNVSNKQNKLLWSTRICRTTTKRRREPKSFLCPKILLRNLGR